MECAQLHVPCALTHLEELGGWCCQRCWVCGAQPHLQARLKCGNGTETRPGANGTCSSGLVESQPLHPSQSAGREQDWGLSVNLLGALKCTSLFPLKHTSTKIDLLFGPFLGRNVEQLEWRVLPFPISQHWHGAAHLCSSAQPVIFPSLCVPLEATRSCPQAGCPRVLVPAPSSGWQCQGLGGQADLGLFNH